jgi:hypothetical protein
LHLARHTELLQLPVDRRGNACAQRALAVVELERFTGSICAPLVAEAFADHISDDDALAAAAALEGTGFVDTEALEAARAKARQALHGWDLRLKNHSSIPLPEEIPLDSLQNYTRARVRALELRSDGTLRTNRERAAQLGCSPKAVSRLLKQAGFDAQVAPVEEVSGKAGDLRPIYAAAKLSRAKILAMKIDGRIEAFNPERLQALPEATPVSYFMKGVNTYTDNGVPIPHTRPVRTPAPGRERLPAQTRAVRNPVSDLSAAQLARRNIYGWSLGWLLNQLRLRLLALGWQQQADGRFVSFTTGEYVSGSDIPAMVNAITGRSVLAVSFNSNDVLIAWALENGATVRAVTT